MNILGFVDRKRNREERRTEVKTDFNTERRIRERGERREERGERREERGERREERDSLLYYKVKFIKYKFLLNRPVAVTQLAKLLTNYPKV